jgi:large subunit ribosomal protein L15
MQIHDITSRNTTRNKKRVGRGGKRGTTSGKGQKGQKARAGHKMRPGYRDQLIRTPKKRGYKNKPKSPRSTVITLTQLAKLSEAIITSEVLVVHKYIKSIQAPAKIVATGSLSSAKEIKNIPASKTAKEAIVKAGGKVS